MLIPYNVDVAMERYPIANWVLIGVTCMVSILLEINIKPDRTHIDLDEKLTREQIEKLLASLDEEPVHPCAVDPKHPRFTSLFTSLFAHDGLGHLLGNMLFLFVFGNAVNAKLGHVQFLVCYFLIGMFEGVVWLLLGPGPAIGSSGAIMGIVGMFLVFYPRNEVSVLWGFGLYWGGITYIPSALLILLYMGWDLVGTIFFQQMGVAYLAHLAGGVAGIAIAVSMVSWRWVETMPDEQNLLQVIGWETNDGKRKGKRKKRKRQVQPDDD